MVVSASMEVETGPGVQVGQYELVGLDVCQGVDRAA